MDMEHGKLYLISFGNLPLSNGNKTPLHKEVIRFWDYRIMDRRRRAFYNPITHWTNTGTSLLDSKTTVSISSNWVREINSCEPISIKDFPLYISWNKTPLYERLLRSEGMVPGNLYKIENGYDSWIIRFYTEDACNMEYHEQVTLYDDNFYADIIAYNIDASLKKEDFYFRKNFGKFIMKTAVPITVEDLPKYKDYQKSPLYYQLLKGE